VTTARILVTGATGYVGSRLVSALLDEGYDVVVATRNPDRLADFGWHAQVTGVAMDAHDGASAKKAFADAGPIDVVYYLVHGIGQPDFRDADNRAAANVADAAKDSGVRRIVYLGGFVQYGFGIVNDDRQDACRLDNVDCSASDTRLGVMGRYHLPVGSLLSPWLGFGVGYEWGTFSLHQSLIGSSNTDSTWSGFEFANLQVGADYHVVPKVALAPFVSVSIGQFRHISTKTVTGTTTTTTDEDVAATSLHEWILIGVRAAFMP